MSLSAYGSKCMRSKSPAVSNYALALSSKKLSADIATTNATTTGQFQSLTQSQDRTYRTQETLQGSIDRLDTNFYWIVAAGLGTVLLWVAGNFYKIFIYDAARDRDMKSWVRDLVGNLESKIDLKIERLESKMDQKFAQMDQKFAQIDQKFAQIDQKFAQMDEKFDQMSTKLDAILKAQKK
ncbi:hypothetical protein HOY80DRAFT_1075192 [Tuber brumale]|nr:hypothetical protein HOY80DRAFT_1075192 [Tuber brumale]